MGKIRVIVKRPGVPGEVTWVDNELKPLQEIVEGYIEVIKYQDLLIICNEEGKIQNLPENIIFGNDIICGTVIICGADMDEFVSFPWRMNKWRLYERYHDVRRSDHE